jgi:predicted dehydrogenase
MRVQQQTETRIGVIGTGVMGGHHTRTAAMHSGCTLVGIYDMDAERTEHLARQYGVTAFRTSEELCAAVDAVIVATPTRTHARVAAACLQAGCHVLLEKPIAMNSAEAEDLVAVSRDTDRILMIGHVERFNPAITVLLSVLDPAEVLALETVRLSPTAGRDQSADVIFDLMIHDIDLALACTRAQSEQVQAMGHCVRGALIDHVTAMLRFTSGATATLTASWVSHERTRKLRVLTRAAQFTVDCAAREVWVHRYGLSSYADDDERPYQATLVEQLAVPNRDPLTQEQEHFFQAIHTGATPVTSAEMGLQTLRIAEMIQCPDDSMIQCHEEDRLRHSSRPFSHARRSVCRRLRLRPRPR